MENKSKIIAIFRGGELVFEPCVFKLDNGYFVATDVLLEKIYVLLFSFFGLNVTFILSFNTCICLRIFFC